MVTVVEKCKELPAEWKFYINKNYIKEIKVCLSIIEVYEKAKL